MTRADAFAAVSGRLASLSDGRLAALLEASETTYDGIGGRACVVEVEGHSVFVKRAPLADLERRPGNVGSTANLFGLPPFFHYRVGSPGLGAWREVAAHRTANEWVLSGACGAFPLMYHHRVLPWARAEPSPEARGRMEGEVRRWGGSPGARARFEGLAEASACVALFLERLPHTLRPWLGERLAQGGAAADDAVRLVERDLGEASAFMGSRGFVHFDVHFDNVLTDGERLYLTDFGLSLGSGFELSEAERAFLPRHRGYDRSNAALGLAQALAGLLPGDGRWDERLRDRPPGADAALSPTVRAALARHGGVALALTAFLRGLDGNMEAPYPAEELEAMLEGSEDPRRPRSAQA